MYLSDCFPATEHLPTTAGDFPTIAGRFSTVAGDMSIIAGDFSTTADSFPTTAGNFSSISLLNFLTDIICLFKNTMCKSI